jgi:hypothetical protein
VPAPVTLLGVIAPQVSPAGTVSVRVTVPENPFTADMVIVDVAEVPTVTAAGEVATSWKSTNWNVTVVELVVEPLVAVTVAVSVSAIVEVQVSVDVAAGGILTLVGLRVQTALPVEVTVRATVPVKLPLAATVIVEVPEEPIFAVTLVGLALMIMPPALVTVTVTLVEFVMSLFVPPVPVTVTV